MPMTRQALSDDAPLQNGKRGKQRGRPVPLVVVRHRGAAPLLHRKAGLGPIQSLNLAFLVYAQNDRLVGRVQIEAHHVGELLDELRVAGELEGFHSMRLQAVCIPDPLDRRRRNPGHLGHRATAPVRGVVGLRVPRGVHDPLHEVGRIDGLPAAAGFNLRERLGPAGSKPLSPQDHRRTADREFLGDAVIWDPFPGQQNDPGASHHALRCAVGTDPGFKHLALFLRNRQLGGFCPHERSVSDMHSLSSYL